MRWTNYLSSVSPEFKSKVGVSTQVKFPTGVGAEKSDGVAAAVSQTDGAIGYLGLAYIALQRPQLRAGRRTRPGTSRIRTSPASRRRPQRSARSTATTRSRSIDLPASATNAYPISTYTYVIVPLKTDKADELKKFITYAIGPGQAFGPDLNFAPLPTQVVAAAKKAIAKIGS